MKSGIELIRLIAVILIVFTHTRHEFEQGMAYFFIEQLPTYGTVILSIVSGYLYFSVSRKKNNLFKRKIKSLAIPYLIANIGVILLVLGANYFLGYDTLNRLTYDYSIITEGVFALNHPPIDPPTYFIRDIFVIFLIIALVTEREFKTLIILVPLLVFGALLLRWDIALLFAIGVLYAKYETGINKRNMIVVLAVVTLIVAVYVFDYLKYPMALLFFVLLIDLRLPLRSTGRYSYLLHLYHAPIIVITFPLINHYVENPLLKVISQIILAIVLVYVFFRLTKRYDFIKVLSGGR
ncbi:MAG: hypothetical protein CR968_01130 [Flavobacteriia bacterium]|nr:MAG: hypothetical protein CR968_01130 [Flavobacteriia bacterium]